MVVKFFSLSSSELFLRGSKFIFFLSLANFYDSDVIYEYGLFTALFSILFVFSDVGYQTLILKEMSHKNSYSNYIKYSQLSLWRVLLFSFISLFFLFYYFFTANSLFFYIFILFLADAIFATIFSFYRALHKSIEETKTKFIIGSIFIISSTCTLFLSSVHLLFLTLSFSYLAYAIVSAKFLKAKIVKLFFRSFTLQKYLLMSQNSIYIFIGSLSTIAYLRADILMLNIFNSADGVTLYSVASRVLELSLVAPAMISALLMPLLIKDAKQNLTKSILRQFFIGIAVMTLFLIISPYVVEIFFKQFIDTTELLNILLLSIPFMLVNGYVFTLFIAKDASRYYALSAFVMLLSNVILNYMYIPTDGYIAAAYTTLLTEVFGTVFALLLLKKSVVI
ncbi:MAG: polysaccharide biosynthesis C-terminal domain-containing protein [Campylobacterota bacterium]|nr:polysaccharide biosynthesis C-terminal domain-containing protein [Campylobacterota bacterium]